MSEYRDRTNNGSKMINDIDIKIVAADISKLSTGLYAADSAYIVHRCDSEEYLNSLIKIFKNESIDFYIPGTDIELKFCAMNKQLILDKFIFFCSSILKSRISKLVSKVSSSVEFF